MLQARRVCFFKSRIRGDARCSVTVVFAIHRSALIAAQPCTVSTKCDQISQREFVVIEVSDHRRLPWQLDAAAVAGQNPDRKGGGIFERTPPPLRSGFCRAFSEFALKPRLRDGPFTFDRSWRDLQNMPRFFD